MSNGERSTVFAALGDPTRLKLLSNLKDGDSITTLCAGLPITRQAVTRHLKVLQEARLINAERVGREVQFFRCPARISETRTWLDDISAKWDAKLEHLKAHVERDSS